MLGRFIGGPAAFLILLAVFSGTAVGEEQSAVLRKLGEIERRLGKIERELQQLTGAVRRLPGGEAAFDVRESAEYKDLEKRCRELQQKLGEGALRNPAEIWRVMGDPKELSRRLDQLAEAFAPTLTDPGQRKEFEQDVQALKEKIGKEVSDEELYRRVRERLSERLKKTTSDREKAWLQRQLDALERSEGPMRKEMIARYVRIENFGAIHELAKKYSIPRELMVSNGFPFVGYGGRPPRRREGSDRPGPPRGGGPRGNSRGRREP